MQWFVQQMLVICCENGASIEVTNLQELSANCVKEMREAFVSKCVWQRAKSREQRAESKEQRAKSTCIYG